MKKYCFIVIVAVLFLTGYGRVRTEISVRRTLNFAGENRAELEKVLEHYSGEKLKEVAARYLIAGMAGAYYYEGDGIDSLTDVYADISDYGAIDAERKEKWAGYRYKGLARKIYDAKVLSADYLIENIELAFDAWDRRGRYYDFDDFCKYVLPYRIGDEKPDHWRKAYSEKFSNVLANSYSGNDIVEEVISLQDYLRDSTSFVYENDLQSPHLGGEFLLKYKIGACREGTDMVTYMLRSLGIPADCDSYIYSPDAYLGHAWNVFMDTTGTFLPTEYGRETTSRDWYNHCSKGKVYRRGEDVTSLYFPSNRVILPQVGRGLDGGFIGVFSMRGWIPVGTYVRTLTGRAVVHDIETEQVYQPLRKEGNHYSPSGFPFYLTDSNVAEPLTPDLDSLVTVRLTRKHPMTEYWVIASEFQDSTMFYGSADGLNWKPLAKSNTVKGVPRKRLLYPEGNDVYRYVKIVPQRGYCISLAELEVYADRSGNIPVSLSVVEAPPPLYDQKKFSAEKAIDGENLTRFETGVPDSPIIFELDRPSSIGMIAHIPHNDDNYVSKGDRYELFYQGGKDGWISLGTQVALGDTLVYNNVPAGALLWLHDSTKGLEEQTFRWMGGRQVFCYEEYYRRRGNRRYILFNQ